ncbi:hypothetical protein AMTRI_Chr06g201410 [Amborella trichopoda]
MNSSGRSSSLVEGQQLRDYQWPLSTRNTRKPFSGGYFSIESLLVLLCLTASLLILPLILPPLPPPPFLLLLIPICIFVVLMVLACTPTDVRDIATTYV